MNVAQAVPYLSREFAFVQAGCRKFFKHYAGQQAALQASIVQALTRFLDAEPAKIKPASRVRVASGTVYEARVNTHTVNMRVAFVTEPARVTVVFVSSTLQKAAFTRELDHFLRSGPALDGQAVQVWAGATASKHALAAHKAVDEASPEFVGKTPGLGGQAGGRA